MTGTERGKFVLRAGGLLRTDIPGVSVAQQFSTTGVAQAIGIGVAVSIAGVMPCEYLALTRLVHAVTGRRLRPIAIGLGIGIVIAAPIRLIDPDGFYNALLKPSLVALLISQLIVFLVYPRVRPGSQPTNELVTLWPPGGWPDAGRLGVAANDFPLAADPVPTPRSPR